MKHNDTQLGLPTTLLKGTEAVVEALTPVEGMIAYATDTHRLGIYTGSAWQWSNPIDNASLTASAALVTDASKMIVSSAVTAAELGYLSGVIGNVQDQIYNHVMLDYPYGTQIMNSDQAGRNLTHQSISYTNLLLIDGTNDRVQIGTNTAGAIADFRATAIVFNEAGADIDFRVESDTDASFFVLDAGAGSGAGACWIGGTPPDTNFRFAVQALGTSLASFINTDEGKAGGGGGIIAYADPVATPEALLSGDRLGFFLFGGSRDTSHTLSNSAGMAIYAEENWGSASSPSYIIFQTTASGATARAERLRINMAGHVTPGANKTQDLGSSALRWNTLYQGTSTAAGTSRTFPSKKVCPVCSTKMIRGSGSLCILGEDRDYEVAMCPSCGVLATEEIKHLPTAKLASRGEPPKIQFMGFHVFEMSGNSRKVRVDFKYQDAVTSTQDGELVVITPEIANSTYLGEEELEEFLVMKEAQQEAFLLQLGRREWDALEEVRLMKLEIAELQQTLNLKIQPKKELTHGRKN